PISINRPQVATQHIHDAFDWILRDARQSSVNRIDHVSDVSKVLLCRFAYVTFQFPRWSRRITQVRFTWHLLDKILQPTVNKLSSRGLRLNRTQLLVDVISDCLGFLGRVQRRLGALLPPAEHVLDSFLDVVPAREALAKKAAPCLRHMTKG